MTPSGSIQAILSYSMLRDAPHKAQGAPVDVKSQPELATEPWWVPEPQGRGTLGLLQSSILTLLLCVWTVLHINTFPNATALQRLLYRSKWVLIGMFFPEALLLSACLGYKEARRFHREWRSMAGNSSADNLGIKGAYFVCMGGLSVGRADEFSQFSNILTPNGFLFLIQHDLIPEYKEILRRNDIEDKSKADTFVKALVCVQALWMLVQCAARKATSLPIPLIELHVSIHVIYLLLIYGIWWEKPVDISQPIPVIKSFERASLIVTLLSRYSEGPLSTFGIGILPRGSSPIANKRTDSNAPPRPSASQHEMGESSNGSDFTIEGTNNREVIWPNRLERIYFFPGKPSVHRSWRAWIIPRTLTVSSPPDVDRGEQFVLPNETLFVKQALKIPLPNLTAPATKSSPQRIRGNTNRTSGPVTVLNHTDIENLRSAANLLATEDLQSEITALMADHPGDACLVRQRIPLLNFDYLLTPKTPSSEIPTAIHSPRHSLIIAITSLCYAGLHATAWNFYFPTKVENWLWRISTIVVGIFPTVCDWILIGLVNYDGGEGWRSHVQEKLGKALSRIYIREYFVVPLSQLLSKLYVGSLKPLLFLFVFLLLACRIYLVIESFASIRRLPKGSFESIPWGGLLWG